jgi:hypothetical protein
MFTCPKGDESDDPEFCSVCGIKMEPVSTGVERCPTCGVERKPGARFCETCRYDFKSQTTPSSQPSPTGRGCLEAAGEGPPTPAVASGPTHWEAIVTVDPALDVEPDPDTPCPTDAPERTFPIDLAENLIGRRSASRGISPQIALNDPGVSHRHLMVYRNPDATLTVLDLGSANGTFLNGNADPLEPGVRTAVADGDQIELGRWTRIAFRLRN